MIHRRLTRPSPRAVVSVLALLTCTCREPPPQSSRDSETHVRADSAPPAQGSASAPPTQAAVPDTTPAPTAGMSPAQQQGDPFTAPIHSTWVNRTAGMATRVRWTQSPDSCLMLVMSDPAAVENDPVPNDFVLLSERDGLWGPNRVWDVAPSPDWTQIAWGTAFTVNPSGRDSVTLGDWRPLAKELGVESSALAAASFPTSGMGFQRGVARPVVMSSTDACEGDECGRGTTLSAGGWRVRWTSDGQRVAFGVAPARTADDAPASAWTLVDSAGAVVGRQTDSAGLAPVRWVEGPTLDISTVPELSHATSLRAGSYTIESRAGRIHLVGSDRRGTLRDRVVGPGIALAATRYARYIAALAPYAAKRSYDVPVRLVVYEFVRFGFRTSCDGPEA